MNSKQVVQPLLRGLVKGAELPMSKLFHERVCKSEHRLRLGENVTVRFSLMRDYFGNLTVARIIKRGALAQDLRASNPNGMLTLWKPEIKGKAQIAA